MKCSWQTFLSPLKGQCQYQALIGLIQTTVQRVVLIMQIQFANLRDIAIKIDRFIRVKL